ncbi:MAG: plasmid stabilization system [Verrucomicrobiaceae bacterium]|nr:plasmid stabilization system [Verrucomicrobiaceae bacterium]
MIEEPLLHPSARDELLQAIRYYAALDDDGELALAFEAAFFRCQAATAANPLHHRLRRNQTRRVNLAPRFGEYYIAYTLVNEKVFILAVAHARRRPYYWLDRAGDSI